MVFFGSLSNKGDDEYADRFRLMEELSKTEEQEEKTFKVKL